MCLQHWSWGHLLNGKILLSWVFIILGAAVSLGSWFFAEEFGHKELPR